VWRSRPRVHDRRHESNARAFLSSSPEVLVLLERHAAAVVDDHDARIGVGGCACPATEGLVSETSPIRGSRDVALESEPPLPPWSGRKAAGEERASNRFSFHGHVRAFTRVRLGPSNHAVPARASPRHSYGYQLQHLPVQPLEPPLRGESPPLAHAEETLRVGDTCAAPSCAGSAPSTAARARCSACPRARPAESVAPRGNGQVLLDGGPAWRPPL
jgi:hypothetical protein